MVRASCTCLFERVIMCILLIFLMYLLTPSRKSLGGGVSVYFILYIMTQTIGSIKS